MENIIKKFLGIVVLGIGITLIVIVIEFPPPMGKLEASGFGVAVLLCVPFILMGILGILGKE